MLPTAVSSRDRWQRARPNRRVARGSRLLPRLAINSRRFMDRAERFSAGDSKATYGTGAFPLDEHWPCKIVPSKNRLVTNVPHSGQKANPRTHSRARCLSPARPCSGCATDLKLISTGGGLAWARDGVLMQLEIARSHCAGFRRPRRCRIGTHGKGRNTRELTRHQRRRYRAYDARRDRVPGMQDVIVAMESDTGETISELRASRRRSYREPLPDAVPVADILGKPVRRAKIAETTAMGAMLAGLVVGV